MMVRCTWSHVLSWSVSASVFDAEFDVVTLVWTRRAAFSWTAGIAPEPSRGDSRGPACLRRRGTPRFKSDCLGRSLGMSKTLARSALLAYLDGRRLLRSPPQSSQASGNLHRYYWEEEQRTAADLPSSKSLRRLTDAGVAQG